MTVRLGTYFDSMENRERKETMSDSPLDVIQELWDELDLTQLLKQHVPPHYRYLLDRLERLIFPPQPAGGCLEQAPLFPPESGAD